MEIAKERHEKREFYKRHCTECVYRVVNEHEMPCNDCLEFDVKDVDGRPVNFVCVKEY